jgi:ribosomal protein L37AE/L43A
MKWLLTSLGLTAAAAGLVLAAGCSLDLGDVAGDAVDRVKEHDADKEEEKNMWCPKCGSDDVERTKVGNVGSKLGLDDVKGWYKCRKCGHRFQ